MLRSMRHYQAGRNHRTARRGLGTVAARPAYRAAHRAGNHPLARVDENASLLRYEEDVRQRFERIVPTLKAISAIQHEADFEQHAQAMARKELGFELPLSVLTNAWVERLDMRRLYAWCVFQTYRQFCDEFFTQHAAFSAGVSEFDEFLQSCGFHLMDISPCADGRLAHVVRYVLRLPPRAIRRKSYAGANFDIEDSVQKWTEIELQRFREGVPNTADQPTRYLKVAVYHFSSSDPKHEGCAAHGSNTEKAAQAALQRLQAFRQAIENSFCCGASIDLLLIGLDTDTDAIRIHVPDDQGRLQLDNWLDTQTIYDNTVRMSAMEAMNSIEQAVRRCQPRVTEGMARLVVRLVENNLSQIEYVRDRHGSAYPDIGHAERFIGAGVGFEEIQLRNLMYFAYLNTVEEGAADLDVGIRIFTGLNIQRGLPAPVVVRFDYHGSVPGARDRAQQRCRQVAKALASRYQDLIDRGLLHVLQVARDCETDGALEIFACSVESADTGAH